MADHLRGRVRPSGTKVGNKHVWLIEVVNTSTGEVVHTDNTCNLSRCCEYARENVDIARSAWRMGLKLNALQRKKN